MLLNSNFINQLLKWKEFMEKAKAFIVPRSMVLDAYKLVAANKGAGGIDGETLSSFETKLEDNLFKIWNRLSSGSYFPPAVKAVSIPKRNGGTRILGIPTVGDRVAQMTVRLAFEPLVEPHFLPDSYGYRPGKSAHDAIAITRKRCWDYDWILEFDIKGLFDNISHELLMKAVAKHTDCKWHLLYIERWLKAPMQLETGEIIARTKGTPQGGVISPVLANLFLHYTFDMWMKKNYPSLLWCRFADDGLIHATSQRQAEFMRENLAKRLKECELELHPEKTKIVYCGGNRKVDKNSSFDFLGYTFRKRGARGKDGKLFTGFLPGVSNSALKSMRAQIRKSAIRNKTYLSIQEISKEFNPILRGWQNYYGKFYASALYPIWRHFNITLRNWVQKKYKRIGSKKRAILMLLKIANQNPKLFIHWEKGIGKSFV